MPLRSTLQSVIHVLPAFATRRRRPLGSGETASMLRRPLGRVQTSSWFFNFSSPASAPTLLAPSLGSAWLGGGLRKSNIFSRAFFQKGITVSKTYCVEKKNHIFKLEGVIRNTTVEEMSYRLHPMGPYRVHWDSQLAGVELVEEISDVSCRLDCLRHV